MPMELHIWGPGFGLPSIDAECLAAVAYLEQSLPPEQWLLVLNHNAPINPNEELPCLVDNDQKLGGYSDIVQHISSYHKRTSPALSKSKQADATALKAHLASNARPLLSYALYNASNYTSHTRLAWRQVIPSNQVFTPMPCADRYSLAQTHITSLGLISSPLDDVTSDTTAPFTQEQQQEARMISSSPSLLFKKRQSVQAALKTRQSQDRFRLEGFVDALMEPLSAMLKNSRYLVSGGESDREGPTSIDALAFGYLALLIYPDLSNNMVADMIKRRYPGVVRYIERLRQDFFGGQTFDIAQMSNAPSIESEDCTTMVCGLPVRTQPPVALTTSVLEGSATLLSRLLRPVTGQPLLHSFSKSLINHPRALLLRSWAHPLDLFLSFAGPLLAGTAWLLYTSTHADMERNKYFGKPRPRIRSMGAAGDMLAGFALPAQGYDQSSYSGQQMQMEAQDTPPTLVDHEEVIDVHVDVKDRGGG